MRGFIVTTCLIGLFAASVPAVDVLQFQKVDYFEVVTKSNGEQDEEKRDARLEIDQDAQQLRIVDEKNGASKATYAEIPFAVVTSVVYESAKSPRVKTAIFRPSSSRRWRSSRQGRSTGSPSSTREATHTCVSTRTTSARSAPHWERLGLK